MIPFDILPTDIASTLGWTLIHNIWQSAVILVTLFVFKKLFRTEKAHINYLLNVLGLISIFSWSLYTFLSKITINNHPMVREFVDSVGALSITANLDTSTSGNSSLLEIFAPYLPLVSTIWILCVALLLVRTWISLLLVQRLKSRNTFLPNYDWSIRLGTLIEKMNLNKQVRLLESSSISVPMVIGHIKPVILVPIGMLTGLDTNQVEAILAHELAHIKRHDYLVNILQSIVESFFFYNPMVWWLSHQIRQEREVCCDMMAIQYGNDKLTYAKALTTIQQLKINTTMAMTLGKNKKSLLQRIKLIVEGTPQPKNSWDKIVPVLVLLGALISLSWYSVKPSENTPRDLTNKVNLTSLDTTIVDSYSETDSDSDAEVIIDLEDAGKITEIIDVDGINKIVDANVSSAVKVTEILKDIDFDNLVDFDLDTIPFDSDEMVIEMENLSVHQKGIMEELQVKLKKLEEMELPKQELHMQEMEEAMKKLEVEMRRIAERFENDEELSKVHEEQMRVHEKAVLEKLHAVEKREGEMMKRREEFSLREEEKRIKEMEQKLAEQEKRIREEEAKIQEYEKELIMQLRADGYLGKKEKLESFEFKNGKLILVNGQEIKEEDIPKYQKLKNAYMDN